MHIGTTKESIQIIKLESGHYGLNLGKAEDDPSFERCFYGLDNSSKAETYKKIKKVHRSMGHSSQEKLTSLFRSKGTLNSKVSKLIKKVCIQCNVCKKFSRARSRPKVGMPKASMVNETVSVDLKNVSSLLDDTKDKRFVLYLIDEFSKFMRGKVVKNKEKETIMEAVLSDSEIFSLPSRTYHADNGSEFSNKDFRELCNRKGIKMTHTPARAPWANGSNERNHASVDITIKKLMADNPGLKLEKALSTALYRYF